MYLRKGDYMLLISIIMQVKAKDRTGWFKDKEPLLEILEFFTVCKQPSLTRSFIIQSDLPDPDFTHLPPSLDSNKLFQKYFILWSARLRKRCLPLAFLVLLCPFHLSQAIRLLQQWSREQKCFKTHCADCPGIDFIMCICQLLTELESLSRLLALCEKYLNGLGTEI